jgi:hypothetical protein
MIAPTSSDRAVWSTPPELVTSPTSQRALSVPSNGATSCYRSCCGRLLRMHKSRSESRYANGFAPWFSTTAIQYVPPTSTVDVLQPQPDDSNNEALPTCSREFASPTASQTACNLVSSLPRECLRAWRPHSSALINAATEHRSVSFLKALPERACVHVDSSRVENRTACRDLVASGTTADHRSTRAWGV